ncbi:MAG: T9SS type A sorting domain-containing protein [Bacteroidota bacterium]
MKKLSLVLLLILSLIKANPQNHWITYSRNNSGIPSDTVNCVAMQSDGSILAGTNRGAALFDGKVWTVFNRHNCPLPGDTIQAVSVDHRGFRWFCTNNGIAYFDGSIWHVPDLSGVGITVKSFGSMCIDSSGVAWFGQLAGDLVCRYDGNAWTNLNLGHVSGWQTNSIRQILVASDGTTWFASSGGGLAQYEGNTWNFWFPTNSGLPDYFTSAMAFDGNGTRWISTYSKIMKTNENLSQWNLVKSIYDTRALALDLNGVLWIGVYGLGLYDFDGTVWKQDTGLQENHVKCLFIDRYGNKWVGTQGGLACFNERGLGIGGWHSAATTAVVFPNPAEDVINIHCNASGAVASVFTMRGEYVMKTPLPSAVNKIDISNLKPGVYMIFITVSGHSEVLKFVKL